MEEVGLPKDKVSLGYCRRGQQGILLYRVDDARSYRLEEDCLIPSCEERRGCWVASVGQITQGAYSLLLRSRQCEAKQDWVSRLDGELDCWAGHR